MKKKKIIIIILIIIAMGVSFYVIDYTRIKNNDRPLFVVSFKEKDNQVIYYGLGYKVIATAPLTNQIKDDDYIKIGSWLSTSKIDNYGLKIDNYDLKIESTKNCSNKLFLYTTFNDQKIYLSCLNTVKVNVNGKYVELKDILEEDESIIDKIINNLELKYSYFDGGTRLYKDGGTSEHKTKRITLIKCHTLDGNRDIYIGSKNMKMQSNYCQDDNKTFTRTYMINSVEEYDEQQFENGIPVTYGQSLEVSLTQFQSNTETVILNNIYDDLKIKQSYEFEFMIQDKSLDDSIQSIFKNAEIVSIKPTNKKGLEQRQEPIR